MSSTHYLPNRSLRRPPFWGGGGCWHSTRSRARRREDAEFELVDLLDHPLPHLDEPLPPSAGQYQNAHAQDWAAAIARFDGFILVTPEYNHSTSVVLKNAIDFLYAEWTNKAIGVVVTTCRQTEDVDAEGRDGER